MKGDEAMSVVSGPSSVAPPQRTPLTTDHGLLTKPALILRLTSIIEPLKIEELFSMAQPLEVELGSGDGSFLAQYAARHPERNFLGVERLLGRLRKLDRKGRRAGLKNLRAVRIEAGYFVEYLLQRESVAALHIYFPDPWPKRRHWPRRLVNERLTELARRALQPGGVVYLRTDDGHYFDQMTTVFAANPAFGLVETPVELAESLTDFERDFLQRGVQTRRAAYRKRG
jgi:tRNA (guanine-N7-)-methyltransferase